MAKSNNKNRNSKCSKCGKKFKYCSCKSPWVVRGFVLFVAVCLISFFVVMVVDPQPKTEMTSKNDDPDRGKIEAQVSMINRHSRNKPEARWLLQTPPVDLNQIQIAPKDSMVKKIGGGITENQIVAALERYAKELPIISEILGKYKDNIQISYFFNGRSFYLSLDSSGAHQDNLEICLVSRDQFDPNFPSLAYYDQNWKSLILAAIDYPKVIFDGLVCHELGHALRHSQNRLSSTSPPGSDLYIEEEVEMHDLESLVFNLATNGRYFASVDSILDTKNNITDFKDVIFSVSINDMRQLDAIVGQEYGGRLSRLIAMQHYYALATRYLEGLNLVSGDIVKEKIKFYRWLVYAVG